MTLLPLTFAKSKQAGFLTEVKKQVATLKAICNDPEKQERDRRSKATTRLAETWQKYEDSQYDVLSQGRGGR